MRNRQPTAKMYLCQGTVSASDELKLNNIGLTKCFAYCSLSFWTSKESIKNSARTRFFRERLYNLNRAQNVRFCLQELVKTMENVDSENGFYWFIGLLQYSIHLSDSRIIKNVKLVDKSPEDNKSKQNKKDIDITFGNVKRLRQILVHHFGESIICNVRRRATKIRCFQELKNTERNDRKWVVDLHDSLKAQKADIGLIIQSQCELKKTQIIFQDLAQKEYRNIKLIDGRDMVEMLIELMVQTKAATNLPEAFKLIGLKCPILYSRKHKRTLQEVSPQRSRSPSPQPREATLITRSIENQREIVTLLEEGDAEPSILKKQKRRLAMMLLAQYE